MKRYIVCFVVVFSLVVINAGCTSDPLPSEFVPPSVSVLVVLGEQPANDANAIVGTWVTEGFEVTSEGTISGRIELKLDRSIRCSVCQDVLFVQVWAYYIWPQHGDHAVVPVGEFFPVFASHSRTRSATFELLQTFEYPSLEIDVDGGMPLDYLEVTMVWYRLWEVSRDTMSGFHAKLGYSEANWKENFFVNQRSSQLKGTLDTNVRGGLEYPHWLMGNLTIPNVTSPMETPLMETSPMATPPVQTGSFYSPIR